MKNNHLALGGLFAALHLLFVLAGKLVIGSELILVIFLPLLSTIYSLKFNNKECAMYLIATFLLCIIFDPVISLIYIAPALVCGSVYGYVRKNKAKELSLLYISFLSNFVMVAISFMFISILFKEVELTSMFSLFINKEGENLNVCIYTSLLLIGVFQAFALHLVSNNELVKWGYDEIESETSTPRWINIGLISSLIIYIGLLIFNDYLSLYIVPFIIAFTLPNIIEFITRKKHMWLYVVTIILFIVDLYLLKYVKPVHYPMLFLSSTLPLVVENFLVLKTFSIKYSNNEKNNIE